MDYIIIGDKMANGYSVKSENMEVDRQIIFHILDLTILINVPSCGSKIDQKILTGCGQNLLEISLGTLVLIPPQEED
jgi:hypothetical protein